MPKDPYSHPVEHMQAGDAFRSTLYDVADSFDAAGSPMWYGWALMDAFLAGIDYAEEKRKKGS